MEQKKEVKPEIMPKDVNAQILEAGKVLQKNVIKAEDVSSHSSPMNTPPVPVSDSAPKEQQPVAKENPPKYNPNILSAKPKSKDKNKGRSR